VIPVLSPVRLAMGDEELLVARAVQEVITAARAAEPEVEVHDLSAADLNAGALAELVSPSLFGGSRVVAVRNGQDADKALIAALVSYAGDPVEDVYLVVTHPGGAKAKALADGLTKAGATVVPCGKLKRYDERLAFVRDEIGRQGGRTTQDAARALLDAVGSDLRELANTCGQLVADTGGNVDVAAVQRYHRGRAEVSGFTVADAVMVGDTAGALEALRWALDTGVDPVPIADALADGVRTFSRVAASGRAPKYTVASQLGMPPWKVERAERQARGWTPTGLAAAMRIAATLNADVKGGTDDRGYALERAVREIVAVRAER
jgi:DNA polymerase III subunit delta